MSEDGHFGKGNPHLRGCGFSGGGAFRTDERLADLVAEVYRQGKLIIVRENRHDSTRF